MIDTGTTLALAARSLKENGASKTYALVSHGGSFSTSCFFRLLIGNRPLLRGKHECHREPSIGNTSRTNPPYPADSCFPAYPLPVDVGNKYDATT